MTKAQSSQRDSGGVEWRAEALAPYGEGVSETEYVSELIDKIYAAALDPSSWPAVLEKIGQFVPGTMVNLFSTDALDKSASRFVTWGDDPHFTSLYLGIYAKLNPIFPKCLTFPLGEVYTCGEVMPHEQLQKSVFYREYMQPQGYIDFIGMNVEKAATRITAFGVIRDERNGYADAESVRRMSMIAPHIRRAAIIGNILKVQQIENLGLKGALEGVAAGVFLFDAAGGLLHANASGERVLAKGDPLRRVGKTVLAVNDEDEGALAELIACALGQRQDAPTEGIEVVLKGKGRAKFLAHALPLGSTGQPTASAVHGAVAALFVRKASIDLQSAVAAAQQLYGLTGTEAKVLHALIEENGVAATAERLSLSPSTVKTHIGHLLHKTGTKGQAELFRLIAGVDGVLPA